MAVMCDTEPTVAHLGGNLLSDPRLYAGCGFALRWCFARNVHEFGPVLFTARRLGSNQLQLEIPVHEPWKVVEQYSNRLHTQEIVIACLLEALERIQPGAIANVHQLLLVSASHAHDRGSRAEIERFAGAIRKSPHLRIH